MSFRTRCRICFEGERVTTTNLHSINYLASEQSSHSALSAKDVSENQANQTIKARSAYKTMHASVFLLFFGNLAGNTGNPDLIGDESCLMHLSAALII